MVKFTFFLSTILFVSNINAQVGVNTIYPSGTFYVDGSGDNPETLPTAVQLANDFWIDNTGNVGIGTTTLQANTRFTIRPNVIDRHGIYFNYVASGVDATAYAIDITSNNQRIRGYRFTNTSSGSSVVYYGTESTLTNNGNISGAVSAFTAYKNTTPKSYALYGITGSNSTYANDSSTWALFSQGRAEISADSSPSDISGVDLQVRNTTPGYGNPATIMLRQSTSQTTNNNLLSRIDFGDQQNTLAQARIEVARDASGGTDDYPTRMTFSTTADGTTALTERMRITNNGSVGIATNEPKSTLDLNGNLSLKHISVNGLNTGGAGSPFDINDGVYLSLNPLQTDDTFRLPNPVSVPGRTYILRNVSSSFTAKLIAYPNNNGGTTVNLFKEDNTTGHNYLYMFNGNFRTVIAISDGLNWTIIGPGNF